MSISVLELLFEGQLTVEGHRGDWNAETFPNVQVLAQPQQMNHALDNQKQVGLKSCVDAFCYRYYILNRVP